MHLIWKNYTLIHKITGNLFVMDTFPYIRSPTLDYALEFQI